MVRPGGGAHAGPMTTTTKTTRPTDLPAATLRADAAELRRLALRALSKRSFAVLSTVSHAGFPHAAGVVYDTVDTTLYVHTLRSSRKARNVAGYDRVAVVVPVRRVPVGPPFSIQFQGRARVVAMDDPEILRLVEAGRLPSTTKHGALDEPDGCFLRIEPVGVLHTYGLGVSVMAVARDPLHVGAGSVRLDSTS